MSASADPLGLLGHPAQAPAVVDGGRTVTYGQLAERVEAWASGPFADAAGRVVVWGGGATLDSVVALLAALRSGAVLVPLPASGSAGPLLRALAPEYVVGRDPAALGLASSGYTAGARLADDLAIHRGPDAAAAAPGTALGLLTSGSEGTPKLVRLSAGNLRANALAIAAALGIRPEHRAVLGLPLCHSFGLSVLTSHLVAGASVAVGRGSPWSTPFWTGVHQDGVTTFAAVPGTYGVLFGGDRPRYRLGPVRDLQQAGGRMPEHQVRRVARLLDRDGGSDGGPRRLHLMYGQTEATARIACLPPERVADKPGSVGVAVPGGRIDVEVDPSRDDGAGEIVYHGPNVMMGYASRRADLSAPPGPARLPTGDVGRLDDEGFLTIVGRLRRFVKIDGRRVGLDEVEAAVAGELRTEVACVADTTEGGERLLVVVADPDPRAVGRAVCRLFELGPAAVRSIGVEELPRTASGKLDYPALQKVI